MSRFTKTHLRAVLSFLCVITACGSDRAAVSQAKMQTRAFDQTIAPILSAHCFECHSGAKPKGKLDLSRRATAFRGGESGPAIVAGDLDESLIWEMIEADEMPPENVLPEADKKIIRAWIVGGARWGSDPIDPFQYTSSRRAGYDWWSLQSLTKEPVPTIDGDRWSRNAIDRFVLAKLKTKGLDPSPRADPRTLVRRIYIDLIGLPPPAEIIDKFEKVPSPTAWEQLVDDLLASQHYGERWARHWLDVVRFGESDGYEYNSPRRTSWHYRDWVIRALNDDMPYDQFTRMQLAGDILKPDTIEGAAAVGFLVAGTHNAVLGTSPAMKAATRHEELEEIAGTVAQTFLGLTVNCARCHDHKFDPITTREYYSFIAALDGVKHGQKQVRRRTEEVAQHDRLVQQKSALQKRFMRMVTARGGTISTTANQVRTKTLVDANTKGNTYRVSMKIAPSVWASAGQATSERDGVIVNILKEDGTVLISHSSKPGAWNGGQNASHYQLQTFDYTGDGSGKIQILLRPFPLHTGRFGGAVDDLEILNVASGKTVFEESFDKLQQRHAPGSQAHTAHQVYFLGTSDRWQHSGTNTIHSVEHEEGNFALQLFSGNGGGAAPKAKTPTERKIQTELDALNEQLSNHPGADAVQVYSTISGKPSVMRVLLRGDVRRPSEEVTPGGIAAVKNVSTSFGINKAATDAQRRQGLANWISHRDNGPFHRVVVNRVWHYHFGQGIVTSPSDFGFNGARPSHPELLDWLAVWFHDHGYSFKQLHKLVVTSATYQQSSRSNPEASQIDASNRFLWRQNPRRVEAEVLRDSVLDIAGQLNRKQFGSGFQDVKIAKVPPAFYYLPVDSVGNEFNRRTIYRWNVRGQRSGLLDTFDCPDPSTKTPNRLVTTTPSQALSQWNHAFVLRLSEKLADRIKMELKGKDGGAITDLRVNLAWRLVLGRNPTTGEKAKSVRLVHDHELALLCRVLLNSNEFILVD